MDKSNVTNHSVKMSKRVYLHPRGCRFIGGEQNSGVACFGQEQPRRVMSSPARHLR
jgi:hypothetical protein